MQVYQQLYICWKHWWKIFAGRSCTASLVAVTILLADWILRPHSFSFKRGNKERLHGARSSEYAGVTKRWSVVLPAPLGQAQSDLQGHCIATGLFAVRFLDHFKFFTSAFAKFLVEHFLCSNCEILNFCCSQITTLYNGAFLPEYTAYTYICFLLGLEKKGHGIIIWLQVSTVEYNSAIMRSCHEIIVCTIYK
jgi:hypothetical protein